jgi:peptidoglycan biosynthesis protein MviN/MurJ (putative lipid II flippase)
LAVWALAYGIALVFALSFQELVLPRMPSLHAGHGLLTNDALYFHQEAVKLAGLVASQGWGALHLFSLDAVTGNIRLLAAVYALFGSEPAWFLPVTCAFHALSATLIYAIGARLWPGTSGRVGGLMAAVFFVLFPSALQWYGQNHKDAFAIAGTLLIVHAWVGAMQPGARFRGGWWRIVLACVAGALLVAYVRSYLGQILAAGLALGSLYWWGAMWLAPARDAKPKIGWWLPWVPVVVLAATAVLVPRHAVLERVTSAESIPISAESIPSGQGSYWRWTGTDSLPTFIDEAARRLSTSRATFVHAAEGAGSLVDGNVLPRSTGEMLAALPRSLQVGLFAPFPDMWVERPTPIRVVGAVETLVWYLFAPGTLLMLLRRPQPAVVAVVAFAMLVVLTLAYAQPVVGTLHRMRYGVWMLLLLVGAVGWARIFARLLGAAERNAARQSGPSPVGGGLQGGMTRVAADGSVVLLLWVLTLVALLVRDLVLVGSNGLGATLAAFYAATMIPMFLHTVLSAPMADALTGPLVSLPPEEQRRQARVFLGTATLLFAMAGGALCVWAEPVVRLVLSAADAATVTRAAEMLRWCTPFLVFSGWTVIGGALLNLRQKARIVAIGQLTAPVITVATLLLFEDSLGIHAAVVGMLAGMAANTAVVAWAAAREGVSLVPSLPHRTGLPWQPAQNYASLVLAALFSAVVVPLNYGFAGALPGDAAPSWAFASKLVQVLTTTAGFAIGAVVLPHLATLVAQRQAGRLRADVFFLLSMGSWIAVVCALAVDALAEPISLAVISGRKVSDDQARQLAELLRLGALQLPFVVSTAIVLKVAAVSGTAWRVTVAAGVGFVVNFGLGLLLPQEMGVDGIAVAAVAGSATACAVLLLLSHRAIGLSRNALLLLFGAWLGLAALFSAQAAGSTAAIVAALTALALIGAMHWWRIVSPASGGHA